MTKPNFFIIGAPKCGTTSLHAYLSAHPQVFMCRPKEPHFFNTDSTFRHVRDLGAYERLFDEGAVGRLAIGEASVWYLYSSEAVKNILAYQPDARFIVMLRNPVEMAPSLHQQVCFNRSENELDFANAWALQASRASGRAKISPHCLDAMILQYGPACSLGSQLERLYAVASRERVHTILLDDLRDRPGEEFDRVQDFLQLPRWQPQTFETVNAAKVRRSPWLNAAMTSAARLKEKMGIRGSLGMLNRLNNWNRRTQRGSSPDDAMRALLVQYFKSEIHKIEALLGRNLGAWYRS